MPITQTKNKVPWNMWDVIWIFLFIFALNIGIMLGIKSLGIDHKSSLVSILFQIIMSITYVALVVGFIVQRYKVSPVDALAAKITKENILTYLRGGIFVGLAIILCSGLISAYFLYILHKPIENPYANYSLEKMRLIAIVAIFLAPVVEEVFFRGFVQPAVCQAIGNYHGVLAVAILFTVLHSQYTHYPAAMVVMLDLSLILGFSRLYFNSIIPGMIGHFINNTLAATAVFLGSHG